MLSCSKCKNKKPPDDFPRDKNRKSGRYPTCKKCRAEQARKRYQLGYREKKLVSVRATNLRKQYGLSIDQFDALLAAQEGRCAICREGPKEGTKTPWYVDHDHKTGKVRGILCINCNVALGHLKDSPKLCVAAAQYLLRFEPVV